MTNFPHAHRTVHAVSDAHGRHVDVTPVGLTPTHSCPCTRSAAGPHPRGRPGTAAVRVATILAAGLVISVLLVVIRDIVTAVAGTSLTGLIVKAFFEAAWKRNR